MKTMSSKKLFNMDSPGFEQFFQSNAIGLAIVNTDGKFLKVNRVAQKIWGYTGAELLKKHFRDITHPDEVAKDLAGAKKLLSHKIKTYNVETRYIHRNKSIIWATINVFLFTDPSKKQKYLIATIEDTTPDHQFQDSLKEAEQRYRDIANNTVAGTMVVAGFPPKIKFVSETLAKMLGYSKAELESLSGLALMKIIYKDDRKNFFNRYLKRLQGKKLPLGYSFRGITKGGQVRWFEYYAARSIANGKPIIQASFIDITKRKEAETTLKLYQFAFEQASVEVAMSDDKGTITFANKAWIKNHGFKSRMAMEKIMGKNRMIFHPLSEKPKIDQFNKILLKRGYNSGEIMHQRQDGSQYLARMNNFTFKLNDTLYLVALAEDITKSKQAELAIKEAKRRYDIALNATGQIFYDYYVQDATIQWFGPIETITGYTSKEFQRFDLKKWEQNVHPDDHDMVMKKLKESEKMKKPFTVEYRLRKKNHDYIYVYDSGSFFRDQETQCIRMLGSLRDISVRKKAEEAQRHSQKQLEDIIEFMPDATLVVSSDKKIIGWNKAIEKMTGVNRLKMLGRDHSFASVPFYGNRRPYLIDLLNKSDKSLKNKYTYVKRIDDTLYAEAFAPKLSQGKGEYLWVAATNIYDDNHKVIGAMESIRNISEKVRASKTIEANENKLRGLMDSMDDIVFEINEKGIFTFYHAPNNLKLYLEPQQFIGHQYATIMPPEISQKISLAVSDNKLGRSYRFNYSLPINGKTNWWSATLSPLIISNKYGGSVAVVRNITHEKDVDTMKTEFVSLASHQLRTPLTSINWNCESLLDDKQQPLNAGQQTLIKEIANSNKKMVSLVNTLLNVARLEMGKIMITPTIIHPHKICQSVIQELWPQIQKQKLKIIEQCDPRVKAIKADQKLLEIIFQNLISNAVKYSNLGGKITIASHKDASGAVIISVTDQGIGISTTDQEKIFTKLFRTNEAHLKDPNGNGLGLYIIKMILEQAGGEIWLTSKENKGSTFYVKLPPAGMKRNKTVGAKNLI